MRKSILAGTSVALLSLAAVSLPFAAAQQANEDPQPMTPGVEAVPEGAPSTAPLDEESTVDLDEEEIDLDEQPTGQLQAEAVPPAESVTVDEVLDADVLDNKGEEIAWVEEVIVAPDGAITHVVVGNGGFLGIGTKEVLLPWQTVRYNPAQETLQIDGNEADLEVAPAYVSRADYEAEQEAAAERERLGAIEPDGIPQQAQTPQDGAAE